jgi:hypothetical protein
MKIIYHFIRKKAIRSKLRGIKPKEIKPCNAIPRERSTYDVQQKLHFADKIPLTASGR